MLRPVPISAHRPVPAEGYGRRWDEVPAVAKVFVVFLPAGSVLFLNYMGQQNVSSELRTAASLIFFLGWIPFILHVFSSRKGLPFMPLFGFIYALYYAAPVFLLEKYYIAQLKLALPDEVILRTERMALVGLVAVLLGYYFLPGGVSRKLPRIQIHLHQKRTCVPMVAIGALSVLFQNVTIFLSIPPQFTAFFTFLMQLASFSMAFLFFYQLKGQLSRGYKIFLWFFLVPAKVLGSLSTGLLALVMIDVLILLGAYWLVHHRYPWKAGLIIFFVFLPFWGLKAEFRRRAWSEEAPVTALAKGKLYVEMVVDAFRSEEGIFKRSYEVFVNRTDMLTTFGIVVYTTPEAVPYWGGQSYATLYWMLIPRAIYPDKPLKSLGQDFGHRYGLLDKADLTTSYNFPQIVELYANFGPVAVVLGMFLIGVLYRILYSVLAHPDAGDGGFLLALVVFSRMCNIESDFSLVFGGLALNIVCLTVILKLFQTDYVRMPMATLRWR